MTANHSKAVVLATARTPFGRLGGGLASLEATTLGAAAVLAALQRSGIDPADVEHVVMGQVLQAGAGQNPARQVGFKSALAKTVTAETVNKVCASGLIAIVNAARLLGEGANDVVVAGGMESMSNAPYILKEARSGYRFGDGRLIDAMIHDGLWDYYFPMTMASQGSKVAGELALTREEQDAFAYESHRRAFASHAELADEIVPLRIANKAKGKIFLEKLPEPARARVPVAAGSSRAGADDLWEHEPSAEFTLNYGSFAPFVTGDVPATTVDRDEAVRADTTIEALAKLKPIEPGGTITPGNAPGVNDGAAAAVLASPRWASEHGFKPIAEILDHATVAWDSPYIALTPAMAAQKLLAKNGMRTGEIDVWEINEAFSSVAITSARRLGLDPGQINKLGGAVAMGHPIGASGARLIGTVINQLRRRGGGLGVATICSGGGQGDAVLIKVQ
jgi:acetyl-CoA C-acetyltransferase